MKRTIATTLSLLLLLTGFSGLVAPAYGQAQAVTELRGIVADETGAYIPAATLVLDDGKGHKYTAQSDELGRYRFARVAPGLYTLTVEVEGFAPFAEQVDLTTRQALAFDVKLQVFIKDEVEVKNDDASVSTEPDKNLSAITLTEKDLEALPDDPDELLETLRQMAGASGGPGDASVYIGGFRERGRIPPKEAIQAVRINANPFAAEFSEPGFSRIEIITKPGSDTFHGGLRFNFNDEALNARNPFVTNRPALQVRRYGGNFSGPIIQNRWGFFVDMDRHEDDENDQINALVLDPVTFNVNPFATAILTPRRMTNFSVRSDYLATQKHVLGFQYRVQKNDQQNLGVGGFDLPERAFNRSSREDTLRFSLTTIASERAVNELRLELSRRNSGSSALNDDIAINVLQAFGSGGNQGSLLLDNTEKSLEMSNNLSYTYKKHTLKMGFRADGSQYENINRSNFGGTFTFGTDFERDALGRPVDENGSAITDPTQQAAVPISSLELYRRVLEGRPGYRPTQFSINRGDPFIGFTQWEMGWFIQDDWRVSPKLTVSYGLRHEFQTHLEDRINFAPRFGLAWQPGNDNKATIRVGTGIFYSRLDDGITFDTVRFDGLHQQQFIISRPVFFPEIPLTFDGASARLPTIRMKAEDLIAPYSFISTVGYERQLPWKLVGSVNYTFNRGVHLLRSRNVNAPVGFDEQNRPILPFADQGPIFQFESTGTSRRHELRTFVRSNLSRRFSVWGGYTLAHMRSDTDNAYQTPADSYDLTTEWGRSSMDARHRVMFGGYVTLPWDFRMGSFVNIASGTPFNITTGRDNNQDTSFTDRPAFADANDPGAIVTRFGIFNPNPGPGDIIIPRNFGQSEGQFNVSFNVSKSFGFGPTRGGFAGQQAASGNRQAGQQGQQAQNQGGNNRGRNNQGRGGTGGGGTGGGGQGGGRQGSFGGGAMRGGGGFGGFGGESRSKYNLTLDVRVQNLFNHPNLAGFNGALSSQFFGTATRTAFGGARKIELSMRFNF
jgi:hypothetical protein